MSGRSHVQAAATGEGLGGSRRNRKVPGSFAGDLADHPPTYSVRVGESPRREVAVLIVQVFHANPKAIGEDLGTIRGGEAALRGVVRGFVVQSVHAHAGSSISSSVVSLGSISVFNILIFARFENRVKLFFSIFLWKTQFQGLSARFWQTLGPPACSVSSSSESF
jgi:hypothetical protein